MTVCETRVSEFMIHVLRNQLAGSKVMHRQGFVIRALRSPHWMLISRSESVHLHVSCML